MGQGTGNAIQQTCIGVLLYARFCVNCLDRKISNIQVLPSKKPVCENYMHDTCAHTVRVCQSEYASQRMPSDSTEGEGKCLEKRKIHSD